MNFSLKPSKKAIYVFKIILLNIIFLELLSYFTLHFYSMLKKDNYIFDGNILTKLQLNILTKLIEDKNEYFDYDSTLGWTLKRDANIMKDHILYQTNSIGIRALREYHKQNDSSLRILAFGDSFTHCDEVSNIDSWPQLLEQSLSNTNAEVLNFGVSGYGLDQAYLRYVELGKDYRPDIILVGIIAETPKRLINVFRPYFNLGTKLPLTKPRFIIIDDQLFCVGNPIPEREKLYLVLNINENKKLQEFLGEKDRWYNKFVYSFPFINKLHSVRIIANILLKIHRSIINSQITKNESCESNKLFLKLLKCWKKDADNQKSIFIVLFFPDIGDMVNFNKYKRNSFSWLAKHLKEAQIPFIDFCSNFINSGLTYKDILPSHYSVIANRMIAKDIKDFLGENYPFERERISLTTEN